ncbi:D-isomer-specific 2-hydroxyacid dehydrogenase-like protein [Stipitochalara longipes BDJ]|nr:D-isomer-specific 2-hydroxyacid dehydrogenase-like protein [Stipitochalara longipes BDJ]
MGDATLATEHILILLPLPPDEKILDGLKKKHPGITIKYHTLSFAAVFGQEPHNVPDEEFLEATILVTLTILPSDVKYLKNTKLIHLFSAGADRVVDTPVWNETTIPITNASGVHGPQISEWVILQILANNHKQKLLLEWQKKHYWGKHAEVGWVRDYVGQRLGVLGYGAIGRQTARVSKALGLDVIAYTASPRNTPESKKETGYTVPGTGDDEGLIPSAWYSGLDKASLHNFLKQDIDILLIAVPLTPQTQHFLGKEEFEILGKKNAFIVNIARGPIIKTDDLIAAVKKSPKEGGLRGAALDVTEPEPLPEDSELWDVENIAVTPHVSGMGDTYADRAFAILDINLTNLEKGKPLINTVSRKKGY